jgi:hypothetical protein
VKEPTAQLDYTSAPRWHQRRRMRLVIVALALAALLVPGWIYFNPIKARAILILAQRRCASGLLRPGQVVFEEDPTEAASLLREHGYVPGGSRISHSAVVAMPSALVNYPRGRLIGTAGGNTQAVLFIGRRSDDDGNGAIIYVDAGLGLTPGAQVELPVMYWCDPLASWTWKPAATTSGGAKTLGSSTMDDQLRPAQLHRRLTLYAGVADPKDARRFTARYAIDGEAGEIEFIFHRVGFIDIRVLNGPLTPEKLREFERSVSEKPH